jgi:hypothetical protein
MTVIRISQVKTGQDVATDVKDRSGRVLLTAGTVLTEKNIKIIKAWGVVDVDVTGVEPSTIEEESELLRNISDDKLHSIELELSSRFRFVNRSHPLISELFEICLQRAGKGVEEG